MQVIEEVDRTGQAILIREIALWPNLSTLTVLNLSRCLINDLDGFPHIPHLEKLILQHNNIEKGLSALGKASSDSLAFLDISHNPVWNFCEIVALESLPRLNHFSCLECPVMTTPYLRKMCFGYLYNLQSLNGIEGETEQEPYDDSMVMNMTNTSIKYTHGQKKKEFKLYNDFSHCPIINTQPWSKKQVEAPIAPSDNLKRSISQVDNIKTTADGPTEKKRKENASAEFNLKNGGNASDSTPSYDHNSDDQTEKEITSNVEKEIAQALTQNLNATLRSNLYPPYVNTGPPQSTGTNYMPGPSNRNENHMPNSNNKNQDRGLASSGGEEDSEDDASYDGEDDITDDAATDDRDSAATDSNGDESDEVEGIQVDEADQRLNQQATNKSSPARNVYRGNQNGVGNENNVHESSNEYEMDEDGRNNNNVSVDKNKSSQQRREREEEESGEITETESEHSNDSQSPATQ